MTRYLASKSVRVTFKLRKLACPDVSRQMTFVPLCPLSQCLLTPRYQWLTLSTASE
jgi:hypothetical protein